MQTKLFDAPDRNRTRLQLECACKCEIVKNMKLLPTSSLPHLPKANPMCPCEGAIGFWWARGRAQEVVSKLMGASSEEKGGKQLGLGDSTPAFPEGRVPRSLDRGLPAY